MALLEAVSALTIPGTSIPNHIRSVFTEVVGAEHLENEDEGTTKVALDSLRALAALDRRLLQATQPLAVVSVDLASHNDVLINHGFTVPRQGLQIVTRTAGEADDGLTLSGFGIPLDEATRGSAKFPVWKNAWLEGGRNHLTIYDDTQAEPLRHDMAAGADQFGGTDFIAAWLNAKRPYSSPPVIYEDSDNYRLEGSPGDRTKDKLAITVPITKPPEKFTAIGPQAARLALAEVRSQRVIWGYLYEIPGPLKDLLESVAGKVNILLPESES